MIKGQFDLTSNLIVDRACDTDASRFGQSFQARRDIYPIAENVAALSYDVTKIDTNAKLDWLAIESFSAAHVVLDLCRTDDSAHGTGKLRQQPVTQALENMPAMFSNGRFDDLTEAGVDSRQGSRLICTHQAAVACDIRREYGCEATLHS